MSDKNIAAFISTLYINKRNAIPANYFEYVGTDEYVQLMGFSCNGTTPISYFKLYSFPKEK